MRLEKNILGALFWRAVYFLSVFLLNIVMARYFNAAGSGWIYYITSYFSFIILLASFSLESGITFFAASNAMGTTKLSWFALIWSLVITMVITVLVHSFYKDPLPIFTRTEFIYFSALYILGVLLTTLFGALFYAEHDFATPAVALTITNTLLILAALTISITGKTEPRQLFLQLFFLNSFFQGLIFVVIHFIKNGTLKSFALPGLDELKSLFRYAYLALFANLVFFLLYRIDYWFVKNTCTVCLQDDLGNYIQVSKLGQMFLLLPSAIATVLFPRTAAGFGRNVNLILPVFCRVLLVVYMVLVLPLIAGGKWLFPFVFGNSFSNMYIPFLLLLPGIMSLASVTFVSAYYAGKNNVMVNLKASLLALVIVIVGDICFIPGGGIQAAAAVSAVAYVICYFSILFRFKADYAAPVKSFFVPARGDFKTVYTYLVHQFKSTQ